MTTRVGALVFCVSVGIATAASSSSPLAIDVGTLGGEGSWAYAISEDGQVVGEAQARDGSWHAFSWTRSEGIVDLGTLGGHSGGSASRASDVNDRGQIVGESHLPDGSMRAFLWTMETGMVDLGTLGGTSSSARRVTENGQVVGTSSVADGSVHAFRWTAAGGMVDLGTLAGLYTSPTSVNEGGRVVGESYVAENIWHAFSWTEAGGMLDLGTLGGNWSWANAVNERGQVAGASWLPPDPPWPEPGSRLFTAFLWTEEDGMIDLGTLGDRGFASWAWDVNDSGTVAGYVRVFVGADAWEDHAFVWRQADGMRDIGTLGGGTSSAYAVTNSGQLVGYSSLADYSEHAFSWTDTGGMVDLGTLGGSFSEAFEANDTGQVVGVAADMKGFIRGVVWKTDPERELKRLSLTVQGMGLSFGIATSLNTKLRAASAALGSGDTYTACVTVGSFIAEATAQSGKRITAAQANMLVVPATDIRTMLECS